MATPAWLAATAGQRPQPGQINQLLASHSVTWIYSGNVLQAGQTTGTGLYVSTAAQYLTQEFTTGAAQTAIGNVHLQISAVGGSPVTAAITPLQVALYASSAGLPTGPALAATTLAEQYVYSGSVLLSVPLGATGLTPSTPYQIVVAAAGTGTSYYAWQRSNQTSGAATSPDGVTWTAQPYGLMFEVLDLSGTTGPPLYAIEDSGARVAHLTYNTAGQLAGITESTAAQGGGSLYSTRTLSYSNGLLIGVS
jgi:hypothetical protein